MGPVCDEEWTEVYRVMARIARRFAGTIVYVAVQQARRCDNVMTYAQRPPVVRAV